MQKESNTSSQSMTKQNKMSNNDGLRSSQLIKLFEDELKDIYQAEKALTKAIPKMIKNATSTDIDLGGGLRSYVKECILRRGKI